MPTFDFLTNILFLCFLALCGTPLGFMSVVSWFADSEDVPKTIRKGRDWTNLLMARRCFLVILAFFGASGLGAGVIWVLFWLGSLAYWTINEYPIQVLELFGALAGVGVISLLWPHKVEQADGDL